jgi:metallo-beta-lactamase family protein
MRLTFLGAAGMVTGSCFLLEAGGLHLLIDCGMFQGKEEELNFEPFGFNPAALDGVILTHAHIDHSGRLPLLRKHGFRGPIYTHPATADLARIMLQDSAYIQVMEAERQNRKAKRAGRNLVEPLYTQDDARAVASQFKSIAYGKWVNLGDQLQVRLHDAGHILGAAMLEMRVIESDGKQTKILFSGDIGQPNRPILRDPSLLNEADYLILESTYGNRVHQPRQSTRDALAEVVRTTIAKGGNLVIPAFAVGRTQEILYEMNALVESGCLPRGLKVVLDSPLAIAATEITGNHQDIYNEIALQRIRSGDDLFSFPGLVLSHTAEDSKALNLAKHPMVIVAASGMCEAGRVVHHLKHNLWQSVSTVLFVGFQAEGTLGRRILDGAKRVRIHGEDVAVRARIESLQGLSAHADQAQLMAWASELRRPPRQTFLVHGEADGRAELARLLHEKGHNVSLPGLGQTIELQAGASVGKRTTKSRVRESKRVPLHSPDLLALSSKQMSALLRELRAVRKAWFTNGPHLPPGQAEDLAMRAGEIQRNLEELRRLIDSANP